MSLQGDEADQAAVQEEMFIKQALSRATGKSGPEQHPDFDGLTCVSCGIDIPAGRLALGKVRCIDCQALLEKRT